MSDQVTPNKDNIDSLLKSFQVLYQEKKWQESYLLLSQSNFNNTGVVQFNLGAVSLKNENFALARLHFERSKSLGFSHVGVVKNNLAIVKKLGLESIEEPNYFVKQWGNFKSFVPQDFVFLFVLVIIVFNLAWQYLKKGNQSFRLFFVSFLILLTSFFIFQWPFESSLMSHNQAIILKETEIREGPSTVFDVNGKSPEGLKVTIDEVREGWGHISSPTEFSGWILLSRENLDFISLK